MKNPLYFTRHVMESIGINQERRPYYRELTGGKSEKAFRLLLTLEYLMIPTAYYYDLRAVYYQKRGVPLFQDELVSMNRTPDFDSDKRVRSHRRIPDLPWREFGKDIRKAIKTQDPKAVTDVTTRIIEKMALFPEYYPMTRHLVESIHRFAYFLPAREALALKLGLPSPRKFVFGILSYHLVGLWYFVWIDRAAAPVHEDGIPLLSSELPDLMADLGPV